MASEATLKMLLVGEDRSASKVLRGAGGEADKTSARLHNLNKAAKISAGGFIVAGGAMVKFGNQASDLAEAQSKANVVFGKSVAVVNDFAETAAKTAGLSKTAALEAQGTIGNLLLSMGKAPAEASKMSASMVQLAADIGSFNNVDTTEVLAAMRSGLTGEIAPLRRFGVNLTDATLKAKAMELGLYKGKGALDVTAKSSAAYALILEQTKTSQGDFIRTSDGLANKNRILKAEFANMTTELGQKALPVMLEFVTGLEHSAEWIDENQKVIKPLVIAVAGLGAAVIAVNTATRAYTATQAAAATITGLFTKRTVEAEAAQVAMGRSTRMLRGQLLAGAAGLALIADGADETTGSMGTLKTAAGGALTGAALGGFAGPPGAAIGAAIGGLTGLTVGLARETDKATKSAKVSLPPWKQYAQTLDSVSGATTKATREMAYQRLESSGLLKVTRELGLSDRVAVNAMTGNEAARKKLSAALTGNTKLTNAQREALRNETGAVGHATLAQLKHNVAIAGNAEELRKAKAALAAFMKAPASKRVSIRGVEEASAQLQTLLGYFRSLNSANSTWAATKPANGTSGLLGGDPQRGPSVSGSRAAGGWIMTSGFYKTNESGPETVWLPRGARVNSATRSQQMMSAPTSPQTTLNVTINAGIGMDARTIWRELTKVAKEAGVTTGSLVLA